MKAKLIKQFGKLKPGIYDWPENLVKKLTDMGFIEKETIEAPKKKKREKAVYEDKAEKHEPEDN